MYKHLIWLNFPLFFFPLYSVVQTNWLNFICKKTKRRKDIFIVVYLFAQMTVMKYKDIWKKFKSRSLLAWKEKQCEFNIQIIISFSFSDFFKFLLGFAFCYCLPNNMKIGNHFWLCDIVDQNRETSMID